MSGSCVIPPYCIHGIYARREDDRPVDKKCVVFTILGKIIGVFAWKGGGPAKFFDNLRVLTPRTGRILGPTSCFLLG